MKAIELWKSKSKKESIEIAKKLANIFNSGDIVLLEGDLGSGKTFFVQQICKTWQVEQQVTSPTFTLIQHYSGQYKVNHFDFYRIKSLSELDQLGWEELFFSDAVTFVEWPQIIEKMIDNYYKVTIKNDNDQREINLYKK